VAAYPTCEYRCAGTFPRASVEPMRSSHAFAALALWNQYCDVTSHHLASIRILDSL
jgi:hypothetical protein